MLESPWVKQFLANYIYDPSLFLINDAYMNRLSE
jgi:hypothetical protein